MNLNFIKTWTNVLIKPKETFEKEKVNASILNSVFHIVIAYLIWIIFIYVKELTQSGEFYLNEFLMALAVTMLSVSLFFVLFQVCIYVIFKLMQIKGKLNEQIYFISLIFAPLIVIFSLLIWFMESIGLIGSTMLFMEPIYIAIGIILYASNLVRIALSETYNFHPKNLVFKIIFTLGITVLVLSLLLFIFNSITSNFPIKVPDSISGQISNYERYEDGYNKL